MMFVDANNSKIVSGQTLVNTHFKSIKVKVKGKGNHLRMQYTTERGNKEECPLQEYSSSIIKSMDNEVMYQLSGWEIFKK